MEVKQAVDLAKQHVADIFGDEEITDAALEEVRFDDEENEWRVTIGFFRPWSVPARIRVFSEEHVKNRTYKVVHLSDDDGSLRGVTDRFFDPVV